MGKRGDVEHVRERSVLATSSILGLESSSSSGSCYVLVLAVPNR